MESMQSDFEELEMTKEKYKEIDIRNALHQWKEVDETYGWIRN